MSRPPDWRISNDSTPIPIAPRKKAAILITIILIDILQITFGVLSLPFIYRHSGYGRRGAWARPWNADGVPGTAILNALISLLTFGGNGLSELHPWHACYSRNGILFGGGVVFFANWLSIDTAVQFAWHYLHFGKEGDIDAYWLGMWSICIVGVTVASVVATGTYAIHFRNAMKREEAEAKVDEISEADPLLGSANGTHHRTTQTQTNSLTDDVEVG